MGPIVRCPSYIIAIEIMLTNSPQNAGCVLGHGFHRMLAETVPPLVDSNKHLKSLERGATQGFEVLRNLEPFCCFSDC